MHSNLFINGNFTKAMDEETIVALNPHDGSLIADVAAASHLDIDLAVDAARKALPAWSRLTAHERGNLMQRWAEAITGNSETLAALECRNGGRPISYATRTDIPGAAAALRYFRVLLQSPFPSSFSEADGHSNASTTFYRAPLGVVGQIFPSSYPLMALAWEAAAALAAGNTLVIKPSELSPLPALHLAALAAEVGIPEGVFNVVPGVGSIAGQRLASHPDVAKIFHAGRMATARRIVEASRGNLKRVRLLPANGGLEVVLDDANPHDVLPRLLEGVFRHPGSLQGTSTRLLVQNGLASDLLPALANAMEQQLVIGNPAEEQTDIGPLPSFHHREQLMADFDEALEKGAMLHSGGGIPGAAGLSLGFYLQPTLLEVPHNRWTPPETRGPLILLSRFGTDEQAIALIKDDATHVRSRPLAIHTGNSPRALHIAHAADMQLSRINATAAMPVDLLAGRKDTSLPTEAGWEKMREYSELRALWNEDKQD